MVEIADLQRRLAEALARIDAGVAGLEPPRVEAPAVDPAELEAAREALAAEREANAQLEERVRVLKERLDSRVAEVTETAERRSRELRVEIDRLKQELADGEIQAQRMRRTNTQLRQSIQALREAAETGLTEPHLINQAMSSELEGLRAAREGDRAEMDAILSELQPLLEERTDA
jgi:chromosome segregation ATPase